MMTTNNDTADLLAGLNALKGRTKLATRKGRHVEHRATLTPTEYAGLSAMRATLSLQVGQLVSLPLVTRLAFNALADRCLRSLKDPVEAAKLRAELIATRDERRIERSTTNE